MNARFENAPRCTATGATTASVLIMTLLMAASTLLGTASQPDRALNARTSQQPRTEVVALQVHRFRADWA